MSAFLPWRPRSGIADLARVLLIAAATLLIVPPGVAGKSYGAWGAAVPEVGVNTAAAEGCDAYAKHSKEFATPAMLAELDAVIASLRIDP
ncbi:MAG: hypothetical protein HY264_10645 [Chloroflexi bacterium]|nr:hypothetical protein [Chloroflexota bacterium]